MDLVVAFDLDGVLLDSEAVKLQCFAEAVQAVYRPSDDALAAVQNYNAAHRGVPRRVKLRHVAALLSADADSGVSELGEQYARLLAQRLPTCALIPGVVPFLQRLPATRYVVSSAPAGEIRQSLRRAAVQHLFAGVYDGRTSKVAALREVQSRHPRAQRYFFGDACVDRVAALASGTHFIALNPHADLRRQVDEAFDDFTDARLLALVAPAADVRSPR